MLWLRERRLSTVFSGVFIFLLFIATQAGATPLAPLKADLFSSSVEPLITLVQLQPNGVRRRLRDKGYSKISIVDRRPPGFTVKACKNGKRFRLSIHRRGRVVEREKIGRCGRGGGEGKKSGLTPPQVRRDLRDRGFEDIRFLDRDLPVYVATACKDDVRYKLRMNRWAAVKKQTRVGRCGYTDRSATDVRDRDQRRGRDRRPNRRGTPTRDNYERDEAGKRPPEVRRMLQDRKFTQITFIDRKLPTYVVRACKNNRRMELRIDGSGWIRGRRRLGRCQVVEDGMKPPQVREALRTRGFSRIRFTDRKLPVYVVEACRHDRKFELRLNRFARVMKKTNVGRCRVERAQRGYRPREVSDILRRRGYTEVDFIDRTLPGYGVTACKRGQKFRMKLNRFAEIRFRRRTGFCRSPVSPPSEVNEYEEVDEEQISGSGRIDPETCQTYLDALVRRNHIHFDVASASLRRASHNLLTRLSRVMNRCPESSIEISGHTDSDGSRDYNRQLSRRRAKTVAGFLAQEGISLRRMVAYGYGEDQPVIRNERTERDKARNRRIEFTVVWGDEDDRELR